MEYIKNSDEYKNIIVYDKKQSFDSLAMIQPYTSILAKGKCGVLFENSPKDISLNVLSYYKICKFASVVPEEYIRFTLYIAEPEEGFSTTPKETDRINIPEYSSVYHKLEIETETPEESNEQTSYKCINPAMFVANKRSSIMLKVYRCIYPLYLLAVVLRICHLLNISKHDSETTLYKIFNNLQILLFCILGVFGISVMRSWKILYFTLLDILLVIAFFFSGFVCIYGCRKISYVFENIGYHFLFYVFILSLDIVAFVNNILIIREYERYSPYEKKVKLVTAEF